MNKCDSLLQSGAIKATLLKKLSLADSIGAPETQLTFGTDFIDDTLEGGLPAAALHELQAASLLDYANTAAFALLLAMRASDGGNDNESILWIREKRALSKQGQLYPPGLVEIGACPDRVIYAEAADTVMALRIAADASRAAAVGAIILSLSGKKPAGLNLTATRRLSLFARETGHPVFLLRDCVSCLSTSAWSRWEIAAAPSKPLEANAPGNPVFNVKLTRHRGGKEGFTALLEWNRETRKFTAHSRAIPAIPVFGKDSAETRKRA